MIVLDTNVLSALMQPRIDEPVARWLDEQPPAMIWTTSICLFEIRMGIEILPDGARKEYIRRSFERILEEKLSHRVFDLGTAAAESAARIMGDLRRRGFGIDIRDLLIAGVVAERKASLATRNIKHFAEVGIDLINPWDERRRAS